MNPRIFAVVLAIGSTLIHLPIVGAAVPMGPRQEATRPTPLVRVAIFDDTGASRRGPGDVEKCLAVSPEFAFKRVKADNIRNGVLSEFDVLVLPGGSGSKQGKSLGREGREAIRNFVQDGGGYVGFCAGAYLASSDYSWSLHILDARVLDRKHWARGTGTVKLKLTDGGKELLGAERDAVTVYYGQGPLLEPAQKDDVPDYRILATYQTEIAKNGAPQGVMKGTTAIAAGRFGKGRVLCFSPHPERTKGLGDFVRHAVRWSASTTRGSQES